MRIVVFCVLSLFCCSHLLAQSVNEELNSLTLHKAYLELKEGKAAFVADKKEQPDGYECVYFDAEKRIRKYIRSYSYPESVYVLVAYYTAQGELSSVLFRQTEPEGYSCQGIAYVDEKAPADSLKIYTDYTLFFDYNFLSRQTGFTGEFPALVGELRLSNYFTVSNLIKTLGIESVALPAGCKKVRFGVPKVGDRTFINRSNVRLRQQANNKLNIARIADYGEQLQIMAVLFSETINGYGKNSWYKVRLANNNEYCIYGAFIEPAEHETD